MKKFTNMTNQKVGQEPEIKEVKLNEQDVFKSKVLNLMDQLLSVRTYGPVDRYLRAGLIKISGKEMLVEAIVDLMTDKSLKEQTKLLESLKVNINDWEFIDTKIDEVNATITENKTKDKMLPHRNKLQSLFNSYGQDEELLLNMVEKSCSKIKKSETAHLRSITAEYMSNEGKYPKDIFNKISEKFEQRSEELK